MSMMITGMGAARLNVPVILNLNLLLLLLLLMITSTTLSLVEGAVGARTTMAMTISSHSSSNGTSRFAKQFLGPHNVARAAVGRRGLVWDAKLAKYAEGYAKQRKRDCALLHSTGGRYGENIFWGSGSGWSPAQAVVAWVAERRWYSYWSNSCADGQECGHYTQIVWGSTRRLGCARVDCDGGRGVFITCNYYPPGNYVGERPY